MGYNTNAKYEIIGRVLKNTTVISYMIKDRTNNSTFPMKKDTVEQLALNKEIYNSTAQVYRDIVNLKGINCKLSQLPKYNEDGTPIEVPVPKKSVVRADLILIGKVLENRIVTDYIVGTTDSPEVNMRVPKDIVIQLALEGRFKNARVQRNGEEFILRGNDTSNLNKLTAYKQEA